MNAIRKILVPTDLSEPSRAAERYALELAEKIGAEVTLFGCYQAPVYVLPDGSALLPAPSALAQLASSTREGLEHERARLGREQLPIETAEGAAAEQIAAHATDGGFDLIVMGTHGRTGLKHLLLGSVAERVLRLSRVPVLTVR